MKTLYLIPARAGSKRLPDKNRMKIGGRTLVQWAAASVPPISDRSRAQIWLSTDDQELAASWPLPTVIMRPAYLCADNARSIDVVHHAVDHVARRTDLFGRPDITVLLQPTSPLRIPDDVSNAINLLLDTGGDAVVSCYATVDQGIYERGWAGRLRPIKKSESSAEYIVPNGAVYVLRTNAMDRGEDWFSGLVYAYMMPRQRSVDIDTIEDFNLARSMIEDATG